MNTYMGRTRQDGERLKIWEFYLSCIVFFLTTYPNSGQGVGRSALPNVKYLILTRNILHFSKQLHDNSKVYTKIPKMQRKKIRFHTGFDNCFTVYKGYGKSAPFVILEAWPDKG